MTDTLRDIPVEQLTIMDALTELADLAKEIAIHNTAYYQEADPKINDAEYDALKLRNSAIEEKFPNQIRASKYAIALRNNHPDFINHTKKLIELGQFNFIELNESLQLDIVKYKILLQSNRLFLFIFRILLKLSFKLYKVPILNMTMIRLGLLSAILQGYYKTKLSGDFKVT